MRVLAWPILMLLLVCVVVGAGGMGAVFHSHGEKTHTHSHGHWHDAEYHEHHHGHDDVVTESLDDHAQQPHDHGWTTPAEEESSPTTLVATNFRRDEWKPAPTFVAVASAGAFAPGAFDESPTTPPPRSRAGPMLPQLIALRSIILQV